MKIKIAVSKERYLEIENTLIQLGIEIDDNADLVLSDSNKLIDSIIVKEAGLNDRVVLPVEDIVLIETYGHTVQVHTENKTYQVHERLYKIVAQLNQDSFLRISNSVVIAKDKVKKISPTLSMKFVLTMANGCKVDVTRGYYYIFKEFFGI